MSADAIAFGPLGLWALEQAGLAHIDPLSLRVLERVPLASTSLARLAVGTRSGVGDRLRRRARSGASTPQASGPSRRRSTSSRASTRWPWASARSG